MSRFPRRGDRGYWSNEHPVTDLNEALRVLTEESPTYEAIVLQKSDAAGEGVWEIKMPWYRHGSSGGDSSGYDYYQIDTALAERLIAERLVLPNHVKYTGGSYEEPGRFVISPSGIQTRDQHFTAMRTKARGMLQPGVHTDLTGEPVSCGWGTEELHYGRQYFDFQSPQGRFRVFPESDEIVPLQTT